MKPLLVLDAVADLLRLDDVGEVLELIERGELRAIEIREGVFRVQEVDLRRFLLVRRVGWRPRPSERAAQEAPA